MKQSQKKPDDRDDPRIYWAMERTFLAWVRTGLALMGFGFVVAKFGLFLRMVQVQGALDSPSQTGWSMWFGTALVLLGVLVQIGAVMDYVQFTVKLRGGENPGWKSSPLGVGVAVCLILIGLAMTFYLLTNK